MIPYENLGLVNEDFLNELNDVSLEVLKSGWYVLGKRVLEFEAKFAEYNNAKYCIGVANGLDALTISLMTFGFEKGSEVIVPANTYIATILAILHSGLTPVLVESELDTYNLNPLKVQEKITIKTKAIMVVHLYGKPVKMNEIIRIAKQNNLKIVEDCAQAHGANIDGKKVGTFGEAGAFSFYPTKNLGCIGDGGAIITNDENVYQKAKMYRNYGSTVKYYNEVVGYNSRLDELQAAFLSVKLKYLDDINLHKRKLAEVYDKELTNKVIKPIRIDNFYDVFHIYPIRVPERDKLKKFLIDNGVGTEIHYPLQPAKQNALKGMFDYLDYPIAEEIHNTILSLPISYAHSEEDVKIVCSLINQFLEE
ncbi:MAG: DegT/DnrJ/EryC1/StrS family aminotransferase [Candidatus Margulisbacteria bacterium]|nr:DegT/DnrJ/EryC1/StrS family aminotransferase [Candidatus Margulisiibacteriota bacterium]